MKENNKYKIVEKKVSIIEAKKLVPAIHFQVHTRKNGKWIPIAHPTSWGWQLVSRKLAEEQIVAYDKSISN